MPPSADRVEPWEQQSNESGPAWDAFKIYRDLGSARSLVKVAEHTGKHRSLMDRWSKAHAWPTRALAYDRNEEKVHVTAMRQARIKAQARNVELASALKNLAAGSVMKMAQASASPDAKPLAVGEIARLLEVAARLDSAALGSDLNVKVETSGNATLDHVAKLTDEDRRARMYQLQRELASRLSDDAEASA